MSFCSLTKGITPKIRMSRFVLINSVLLNRLRVWMLKRTPQRNKNNFITCNAWAVAIVLQPRRGPAPHNTKVSEARWGSLVRSKGSAHTLVDMNLRATELHQGTLLSDTEAMHFEQLFPVHHSTSAGEYVRCVVFLCVTDGESRTEIHPKFQNCADRRSIFPQNLYIYQVVLQQDTPPPPTSPPTPSYW